MNPEPQQSSRRCPICGKPTDTAYRPFCSRRCADVDLHRWLGGIYTVPSAGEEAAPDAVPSDSRDD